MRTDEILTLKLDEERTKNDIKQNISEVSKPKTYSYDEVIASTREYFKGDELAATVWANKYALKDSYGNLYELNPDQMHRRIAKEIARVEKKYINPLK